MESSGYHTVKELHNGAFFVDDFIFITNKLYRSLRQRRVIDGGEEELAGQMNMKRKRAGAVKRPMMMQL